MYRYRDTSGCTNGSLKALKHLPKIGKVKYVKAYCYAGRYNTNHCAVIVRGEKGSMRLNNFAWGYSGQGPRGLETFLKELNIDQQEINRVLNVNWDGWSNTGEHWRINAK